MQFATPDPLVVKDAFAAGLSINQQLRAEQRGKELGYQLAFSATPESGGVAVTISLTNREGLTLEADTFFVKRENPTIGGFDKHFEIEHSDQPLFIPLPTQGRWYLTAVARRGASQVTKRTTVWGSQ